MKHENNGMCLKCHEIFSKYADINLTIFDWFCDFQKLHPEVHVSEAGRGKIQQNYLFEKKATKAQFGQSAHNYNCAVDIFVLIKGANSIYPREWFYNILWPNIPDSLVWYGIPGSRFFELPHIELKGWRELARAGSIKLVESEDE